MTRRRKPAAISVSPDVLAANAEIAAMLEYVADGAQRAADTLRPRQDRSRKSGHAHSLNIQDHAALRLSPVERAIWKFCNVAALLSGEGDYYDLLPPSARMAVDAMKGVAATLERARKGDAARND